MPTTKSTRVPSKSLIGQQFGRLTVLALAEPGARGETRLLCQCACGTVKPVVRGELTRTRADATRSCGCSHQDKRRVPWEKHGQTHTRTYRIWKGIVTRCTNPHHHAYHRYGGRGIQLCEAWRTFANFYADMGECPSGLTIERVDNNGHYEMGNCLWATYKVQANNTRRNVNLTLHGVTHTISEWSVITGIAASTLYERIRRAGWTNEEALTLPPSWRNRLRKPQE